MVDDKRECRSVSEAFKARLIFGLGMGWSAMVVSSIVALVRVSLLFRYLESNVLGIWFLMIGAQATLGLLDFGFAKTLGRRLAFAKGKCGPNPDVMLDAEAQQSIRDLFAIARRVYNVLSIVVLVFLTGGGFFYFLSIDMPESLIGSFCLAWAIMCVGYGANMWGWYIQSAMNGLGDIGYSKAIASSLTVLSLGLTWLVLVAGWGLPALAAVWVFQGVLQRTLGWLVIRKRNEWLGAGQGRWDAFTFRAMISPSMKWWLVVLGTVLSTDIAGYAVGAFLGASNVPDLLATLRLLALLGGVGAAVVSVGGPLYSQLWAANDLNRLKSYVFKLTRIGLSLASCSLALVAVYGPDIFEIWLGKGHFIGYPAFPILVVHSLLTVHWLMLMTPSLSAEKIPFAKYILPAGILNVLLLYPLTKMFAINGVCISLLVSSLATVHWGVPLVFMRLFHVKIGSYCLSVLLPALALGGITLLLAMCTKSWVLDFLKLCFSLFSAAGPA